MKKNTPTIQTERLILRKFTEADVADLFAIYSDQAVNTYLPWFPLATLEEANTFYDTNYRQAYQKQQGYRYAICLKEYDQPIGYVNVSLDDSYDFGYGLRKEFWHKGIVTEAGQAVIEQLRKDGIPYITATHDVDNPRSGEVMKRLGMIYQYSYEEQWQPKNRLVIFKMYQLNLDENQERVYQKYWNCSSVHFVEENL
ncbi:GNAT family N-acetyltransferase [Enterococcus sp. AZ192]|uniref:GNAT family N-acetyltransferase n=1 Tax=unclassified Enterococcus TaxID=2608891 RepID=UPI003D2D2622